MHDAGMEFSNYRFSTFRNLSSPSASNFRGQAMFRRMKSRPASPYIAPGFMRSFASSSSFVSSSSDVSPDARQSTYTRYVPSSGSTGYCGRLRSKYSREKR